jgi:hypothetical protein
VAFHEQINNKKMKQIIEDALITRWFFL